MLTMRKKGKWRRIPIQHNWYKRAEEIGAFFYFYMANNILVTEEDVNNWIDIVPDSNMIKTPIEGTIGDLTVDPDPTTINLVILYPANIRVLHSVIQESLGWQIKLGWINDPNSKNFNINGVEYRLYQQIPQIPWEQQEKFIITL